MLKCLTLVVALAACSKKSDEQKPAAPSGPQVCVDGEMSDCKQSGLTWTGAQCCSPAGTTCADGEMSDCKMAGGKWTGTKCCLAGTLTCTAGTMTDCKQAGQMWTGTQCCLK